MRRDAASRTGPLLAAALLVLLGSLAASPAGAQRVSGEDLPVVEDTLENGMRVLVLRRDGAPTVSFVVRYGVGSVHEHVGDTGTAHLLEHMLFKGTTTIGTRNVEAERELFRRMDALHDSIVRERASRGPDTAVVERLRDSIDVLEDSAGTFVTSNEFDRILSEQGARGLNATTSAEATTYFVQLPANRARLWFVLEADRMSNPVFREFYAERDVVAEERRTRIETSPSGRLVEEHLGAAFRAHPYGVPVIGYMSDIRNLSRRQVRAYHERFYGAGNAVVAVVGDVEPDSILRWADAYLGRVPEGQRPAPVLTREPEQRGERRIRVEFDAEPQLRIGWHVVDTFHPDRAPLRMLSAILTGGRTSRLERRMVRDERLATSVSSTIGPGELHPGLFTIHAVPRAPHTGAELEAAVYEELDRLRESPPDDRELERVRNQLAASRVRRLDSNFGLASQLAASASLYGDWRETFRLTDRLLRVEPGDVQRVVRRYFTARNRTVAVLVRPGEEDGR